MKNKLFFYKSNLHDTKNFLDCIRDMQCVIFFLSGHIAISGYIV